MKLPSIMRSVVATALLTLSATSAFAEYNGGGANGGDGAWSSSGGWSGSGFDTGGNGRSPAGGGVGANTACNPHIAACPSQSSGGQEHHRRGEGDSPWQSGGYVPTGN